MKPIYQQKFSTNLFTSNSQQTEPSLQLIEGEIVNRILGDNASLEVRLRGVWRDGQNAFFDIRITNTNSAPQYNLKTESVIETLKRKARI